MDKLRAAASSFGTLNPWAMLVGAMSLAVLILWPKVSRRIPGSLVAVLVSIAMVQLFKLPVNTIGSLYSISSALPVPSLPAFDFDLIRTMLPDAFTIALLAGIESLLSCVVSYGMIGSRHDPNMELVAQGAAISPPRCLAVSRPRGRSPAPPPTSKTADARPFRGSYTP